MTAHDRPHLPVTAHAAPDRPTIRPPRRIPTFRALEHRSFRQFFPWYVISLIGIWVQRTALAWLVVDLTGSAFYVGLTEAMGTLPVLLFTLYAGAVADRVRRDRMVLATQIAGVLLAGAFTVLVYTGEATMTWILALTFATGVIVAFDIPARQSFLADLVGKADLGNAIALNATAFNGSRVVGPAVAGVLIGVFGVGICFALNAVSYLPVILVLFAMDIGPTHRIASRGGAADKILEGLRYVARERRVRRLVVNITAFGIFGLPAFVLLPVLAKNVMLLGAREYGWMMSAVGLGAVVGALAVASLPARVSKDRVLAGAAVSFGILLALLAVVRSLPWLLVVLTLSGGAMIITSALTNTLLQTLAPDELRGRVISVYTVAFLGMAPIGSLLMGVVGERFGVGPAFAIGGVVIAAAAVLALMRAPDVRALT